MYANAVIRHSSSDLAEFYAAEGYTLAIPKPDRALEWIEDHLRRSGELHRRGEWARGPRKSEIASFVRGDEVITVAVTTHTGPRPTMAVSRHPALIHVLRERGVIDDSTAVHEHVSVASIRRQHVVGILPHHLSSYASSITEIPMRTSLEDRQAMAGGDLSVARTREIAGDPVTYVVQRVAYTTDPALAAAQAIRYAAGYHGQPSRVDRLGDHQSTYKGLDVDIYVSMCGQFSAEVLLARGVWRPITIKQGPWLDGLGQPVDDDAIAGAAGWWPTMPLIEEQGR